MSTNRDLEKRIAAIERQLNDGNQKKEKLDFIIKCLTSMMLQFADDFRFSTPEIDRMLEKIRREELKGTLRFETKI